MSEGESGGPRKPLPETEDELELELDEWDKMFDSLVEDEALVDAVRAAPEPVADRGSEAVDEGWPDPPTVETGDELGNLVAGGGVELAGEPQALGSLLGTPESAFGDEPTPRPEPQPTAVVREQSAPNHAQWDRDDDSGLLTSAPRPAPESRPPPRRHPTIVRREDLARIRQQRDDDQSPAPAPPADAGDGDGEISDVPTDTVGASELDRIVAAAEARVRAGSSPAGSAAAFFEGEATAGVDLDEFYADIEVGDDDAGSIGDSAADARAPDTQHRVSRHVVRRETVTPERDDAVPIEMEAEPAAMEVTAEMPDDDATAFEMMPAPASADTTATGDGDDDDEAAVTADGQDDEAAAITADGPGDITADGHDDGEAIEVEAEMPDDDATSFEMAPAPPPADTTATGDDDDELVSDGIVSAPLPDPYGPLEDGDGDELAATQAAATPWVAETEWVAAPPADPGRATDAQSPVADDAGWATELDQAALGDAPSPAKGPDHIDEAAEGVAESVAPSTSATPPAVLTDEALLDLVPSLSLTDVGAPPHLRPPVFSGIEPGFDADALALPEEAPPMTGDGSEDMVRELSLYESEIDLAGDDANPLLWLEAGRLTEKLGDPGRARVLYTEALARDPELLPANRALRRIACALADAEAALEHLDREIAAGEAAERRALGAYRAELLLSLGELAPAAVALDALVEEAPGDIRALMARLELAARQGNPDRLADGLVDLETVLADRSLAAAAFAAGELLRNDAAKTPLAGLPVDAVAAAEPALAAYAHLFAGRALANQEAIESDGVVWDPGAAEASLARAAELAPGDPRILMALADVREAAGEMASAAEPLCAVVGSEAPVRQRVAAATRAGRLFVAAGEVSRGHEVLASALALDPGDAQLAAELAAAVADDPAASLDLLHARAGRGAVFDRVAYARALAGTGQLDEAIAELGAVREQHGGPTVHRALAEMLAAAGRWAEVAALWEAAATADESDLATWRAARANEAWALATGEPGAVDQAIAAFGRVAERDPQSVHAHAALLRLASLAAPEIATEALAAAETAAPLAIRAGTMALRRAAAALAADPPDVAGAEEILRQALADSPADPRPATALWILLAGAQKLDDAAAVMTERAEHIGPSPAATRLKYRAAGILLEACDETARARALLDEVVAEAPGLAPAAELRRVAYRRLGEALPRKAGDRAPSGVAARPAAGADAFSSLVREAETCEDALADRKRAAELYARALAVDPANPLARDGFVRASEAIGDTSALAELAFASLRRAEEAGDATAKADAYEELARIDADLRGDAASALLAFESAAACEPGRALALRAMERACAEEGRLDDLAGVYERQISGLPDTASADRVALLVERGLLGQAQGAPRSEVAACLREALARKPEIRLALFHLEAWAREGQPSEEHLALCDAIATLFADDSRAHAGFQTRAAEIALAIGDVSGAIERYRAAAAAQPSYDAALAGWRRVALLQERFGEAADAALAQADGSRRDSERARLYHLAGVLLMERAGDPERAIAALRKALSAEPAHADTFARLRSLYIDAEMAVDLSHLYYHRLDVTDDDAEKLGLLHALARLHIEAFGDIDEALACYHHAIELFPEDARALAGVADLAWQKRDFAQAADALIGRARVESDPAVLAEVFSRLGEIYADHMPEPEWAKKSYHKVLALDPRNTAALGRLADLGESTADYKLTLAACERLLKLETETAPKIGHLHRIARICGEALGDAGRAERAYKLALDMDPTDSRAIAAVMTLYRDNPRALRVTLDRVALAMRERIAADVGNGPAYRALSRCLAAREAVGVPGSLAAARCAAEIAVLLGAGEDAEHALARGITLPPVTGLALAEAGELVFPRTLPGPVRNLVAGLSGRLGKVLGADVKRHRVGRGDRLGPERDPGVATLAAHLGVEDIEVYLSAVAPTTVALEATSPVSLVVGSELVDASPAELRFAVAGAVMLARAGLAPLWGMAADKLALLIAGIVRQYQGGYVPPGVDASAAESEQRRLRKLIPGNLRQELSPYAYAIAGSGFDAAAMLAGMAEARNRAGLAASGSFAAAARVFARQGNATDLASVPELSQLARFAVSEDYVALAALLAR